MDKINKNDPIKANDEEVDLGKLFSLIGNVFSRLFQFFGDILKGIFHYFILFLLFIKKHFLKLGIAVLLGGSLGFLSDYTGPTKYTYDMIIQPNYRAIDQIWENINYYNVLIKQRDTNELAEKLNISNEEANNLVEFELISYDTEKDKLISYDNFIKRTDTLTQKYFTFEDFKKEETLKFNSEKYIFSILTTEAKLPKSLQNQIIKNVEKNQILQEKQHIKLDILKTDSMATVRAIDDAINLRNFYKKVALLEVENNKGTPSTYIEMSKENKLNNDIELFKVVEKLKNNLIKIKEEKETSNKIINIISPFNSSGKKAQGIQETNTFRFGILFGGAMLLFILIRMLNEYLLKYQLKKN